MICKSVGIPRWDRGFRIARRASSMRVGAVTLRGSSTTGADMMDDLSPEAFAQFVSEDFRRAHAQGFTEEMRRDLAIRIETVLRTAIRAERSACVAACARRHDLWSSYEGREEVPSALRGEARARANEAAHLADALRVRGEVVQV